MAKDEVLKCCGHSNIRPWVELTSTEVCAKRRFRYAFCEHCGFYVVEIEFRNIFNRLMRTETIRGKKGTALFYELRNQTAAGAKNHRTAKGNNAVGFNYAKYGIDPETKQECQEVRALSGDRLDEETPRIIPDLKVVLDQKKPEKELILRKSA